MDEPIVLRCGLALRQPISSETAQAPKWTATMMGSLAKGSGAGDSSLYVTIVVSGIRLWFLRAEGVANQLSLSNRAAVET